MDCYSPVGTAFFPLLSPYLPSNTKMSSIQKFYDARKIHGFSRQLLLKNKSKLEPWEIKI